MARASRTQKNTRIQREKKRVILDAALAVFADKGYHASTIDQIAALAGLSKPNILYYFDDKQSIHTILLENILEDWLEPLKAVTPADDPVEALLSYIDRKVELAFEFPRESRLFAYEVMRGAQTVVPVFETVLRPLVDQTAQQIDDWVAQGKLAPVNARHLLFMIWATTQHYSDFEIQVKAMCPDQDRAKRFEDARQHLASSFRRILTP